jgi:hypothetical protein
MGRIRSRPLGIDVDRYAQERKVATRLEKLLPHGQLLTAASPAGPHEDEQPLAAVFADANCTSVQTGQDDRR